MTFIRYFLGAAVRRRRRAATTPESHSGEKVSIEMFATMKDSVKAIVYTVLVLLLAVAFSFIPGMNSLLYMLTPTIAVLLMMLVVTRDGYRKEGWKSLGLHKPGRKGWAFALIVPAIPLVLSFAVVWLTGMAVVQPGEDFAGFPWPYVPIILVILYVKAVLIESMGEELGWRGYLLPLLTQSMNPKAGMLLSGFIHGIWHFPIIIMTDQYHADEALWLILPMTVLSTVFLAPVIGQLRLKTGSVWPASMMHTTHNLVWLVLATVTADKSEAAKYVSGDMGIVVLLFYIGLTVFMWRKRE